MNCLPRIPFVVLGALLTLTAACRSEPDTAAIRAVIEAQQAAWNKGDIEGFMDGYARAETTTFISGDELTRGWQTVLDRYKRRYSSQAQMGELTFSEIDFQPIDASHVLANGRWQLRLANDSPHGRFTLLFRRTANGWKIVHDTTTSAE